MSIYSYPERGRWGKASWRGNCTGYLYRDLFQQLAPKSFCDPMVGSGTSVEVAQELGIEAYGFDLHMGFNVLRESIRERIGKGVDLCLSHPPYHDIIVYSGHVYPDAHPDDLSRCASVEEFLERLQVAMLNQRDAVSNGGYYGILIGDIRRNGAFFSLQAECIARMPTRELRAVLIKAQHNVRSDAREYSGLRLPRLRHEYVLLWQRPARVSAMIEALEAILRDNKARAQGTWKSIVEHALISLGGSTRLPRLYDCIAANAPERLKQNPHWREKVRQTLQLHPRLFASDGHGTWSQAA